MNKVKRKEMVESINDHERRINRFERLLKKNGFGFDLPELPKTGDFFEIVQHHSQKLPKGKVLEVAKVNHNTNLIKFVGGFNGYFTDFDRSVYLGGAEDEPMKLVVKNDSLIERETVELTGNELCLKLLSLDLDVMCDVKDGDYRLIFAHDGEFFISSNNDERERHKNVTPISSYGEPLTAADVGL